MASSGRRLLLVHGGSAVADELAARMGSGPRYLTSSSGARSRYSDAASVEVLTMAMAGLVNSRLVSCLRTLGAAAVGVSGIDGGLLRATRKGTVRARLDGRPRVVRDDLAGRLTGADARLIHLLWSGGYLPVVSPPAADDGGTTLNVDADRVAAVLAAAVGADHLVMLTNVPGLLADPHDPGSLVRRAGRGRLDALVAEAQGRMRVKLAAARDAIDGGVARVTLADGRGNGPLVRACAGGGTVITASESDWEGCDMVRTDPGSRWPERSAPRSGSA
jgi:acetylglutamate/LysW-gamma-L-alpha-aminoadipate kinase